MKLKKLATLDLLGVLAAAGIGLLGVVPASGHADVPTPWRQSLRSPAARNNLCVGTAVDMAALDNASDPRYRSLVATQANCRTCS